MNREKAFMERILEYFHFYNHSWLVRLHYHTFIKVFIFFFAYTFPRIHLQFSCIIEKI